MKILILNLDPTQQKQSKHFDPTRPNTWVDSSREQLWHAHQKLEQQHENQAQDGIMQSDEVRIAVIRSKLRTFQNKCLESFDSLGIFCFSMAFRSRRA
jgi:hypothetical protein